MRRLPRDTLRGTAVIGRQQTPRQQSTLPLISAQANVARTSADQCPLGDGQFFFGDRCVFNQPTRSTISCGLRMASIPDGINEMSDRLRKSIEL